MALPTPRRAARTFWGFATKVAGRKHVKEILGRYGDGQNLQGRDYDDIRALIDLHPDREIILDGGLKRIFVQHLDLISWQRYKGTRRFCVEHLDSSYYDFSWRDAFQPRNKLQKLSRIFRRIVYPDNEAFRREHFRGFCEACGEDILEEQCEVDHLDPTFAQLRDGFLKSIGKTADDIAIVKSRKYGVSSHLEDYTIEVQWREYHSINARLRCVCARCNRERKEAI